MRCSVTVDQTSAVSNIRYRVGITPLPEMVDDALASATGLSGRWIEGVHGTSQVDTLLTFVFGQGDATFVKEVTDLTKNRRIAWRCVKGPKEWFATAIHFDLSTDADEIAMLSTHDGWKIAGQFMHRCSTKCAFCLLGLTTHLEGGPSGAFPYDKGISN